MMDIQIEELIEGAKKAKGLTVVIDVFRAFSLECYLFAKGAERIYPIGSLEEAFAMKREDPARLLFGERDGARVEGCDYGNSPAQIQQVDLTGRTIIHSTSAGTQGIVNASGAQEIITGALVNARAVARYIRQRQPERVTLVAMGKAGLAPAREDEICAEYIRALVEENAYDIEKKVSSLREDGGQHFFDPARQAIYPEKDFYLSTAVDCFDFVIRVSKDEKGRRMVTACAQAGCRQQHP